VRTGACYDIALLPTKRKVVRERDASAWHVIRYLDTA